MYHAIVRRRALGVFEALSRGAWQETIDDIAPNVHHVFAGEHALGGERHSRAAMARWFERLFRLFPRIEFEVHTVAVRGWPWQTTVAVEWSDSGEAADGVRYENHGSHWLRLRWGKVVYVHGYLDTAVIERSCRRMAAAGIDEAAAPPIV